MGQQNSYRFISSYDKFKRCVNIAKKLLEKKQLMLLFGYKKKVNFDLWLNSEKFSIEYPDIDFEEFQYILFEEIAFIIEQNIVEQGFEEHALTGFLREEGFNEADIPQMVQEKANKRKYVQEELIIENASQRYAFKESTLTNKLSNLNYEINKYVFSGNCEMPYAVVEFVSTDRVSENDFPDFLFHGNSDEKIKFVCDKQDLEYIIMQLKRIKEKL